MFYISLSIVVIFILLTGYFLYKKFNFKIIYFIGILLIIIILFVVLKNNKEIILNNVGSWLGFFSGYGLIFFQIKYSEHIKRKNFKEYILEVLRWNLDKIKYDNLEIEVLNLLTFSNNYITIEDLKLDILYLIKTENFSEANSLMINLRVALNIQNLNSTINIFNELINRKKYSKDNDFFYFLNSNINNHERRKIYKDIKNIDCIIRNYLHFLRTKQKFDLLKIVDEKFLNLCNIFSNDKNLREFYGEHFLSEIIKYKDKEKDINFIYKMFDLMCIKLNKLSLKYENKYTARELNINIHYNNSDDQIYNFLRAKSNEIRVIQNLLPTIIKESNTIKTILKK